LTTWKLQANGGSGRARPQLPPDRTGVLRGRREHQTAW